jgi:hypothetical protein
MQKHGMALILSGKLSDVSHALAKSNANAVRAYFSVNGEELESFAAAGRRIFYHRDAFLDSRHHQLIQAGVLLRRRGGGAYSLVRTLKKELDEKCLIVDELAIQQAGIVELLSMPIDDMVKTAEFDVTVLWLSDVLQLLAIHMGENQYAVMGRMTLTPTTVTQLQASPVKDLLDRDVVPCSGLSIFASSRTLSPNVMDVDLRCVLVVGKPSWFNHPAPEEYMQDDWSSSSDSEEN